MGYYDSDANVEQYISMAEGYDGSFLIDKLKRHLEPGKDILEIGMGPGKDLDLLNLNYRADGSDNSQVFLDRYSRSHPGCDVFLLDAVSLESTRTYDALYSNKVLHHLNYDEMKRSFRRQAQILNPRGIALHSFWYGEEVEEFDGLYFYQVTEERLTSLAESAFEIIESERYGEMEENDSLYVLLRRK